MNELVDQLIARGALKTPSIIEAFRRIDRKKFVLPEYEAEAYGDYPLPIGHGQTISQPYTVAFMLERLQPQAGNKILDLGSGSGWTTALLASIVGPPAGGGLVFGLEIIPELVEFGQKNLQKFNLPQAKILQAGRELGLAAEAPFDRILVSAAGKTVPQELLNQLKVGGVMVIPVGNDIWRIEKRSEDKLETERYPGFVFVPLVSSDPDPAAP